MPLSRRPALSVLCLTLTGFALAGCGGGDAPDSGGSDAVPVAETGFDESDLPADFPTDLIPPHYDSGSYVELGPARTASFESSRPVQEAIDHYTGQLGEPAVTADAGEGQRTAQWRTSPWSVSVTGTASETIVGITRVAE